MRFQLVFIFLFLSVRLNSIVAQKTIEQNERLHLLHKSMGVKSTIIVYNQQKNKLVTNDTSTLKEMYAPNSTFFLYEALIGLESGNIKDSMDVLPWDMVWYKNPNWNGDQHLSTALKHQTEWYFQRVARAIDNNKMQSWLAIMGYGNKDISGGIDKFWANNSMKISVRQQFDLFKKLYYQKF